MLACGLDYDYPKGNSKLKTAVSEHGAVITEYPMGTIPKPAMFPPRNRVMAGMTNGSVIIGASETSGALITARLAFEYNRDVFVVPGEIFDGSFRGSNRLIQQEIGTIINGAEDIFSIYTEFSAPGNKIEAASEPKKVKLPEGLDEEIVEVYNSISSSPQTADEISYILDKNIAKILTSLTTLELLGLVKSLAGGFFVLT